MATTGRFIGGISFGVFADTAPMTKSLAKGRASMAAFASSGSKLMGIFGVGVGGATVTGAIYKAGQSFESLNRSMTKSLAIMSNVSQKMRNEMTQAAIDVSRTTNASASQAADAYFYLASAGLNAEQSLAAMPQVAKFAQAGNFDLALATDLATDAQSALGMTVKDSAQNLENMTRVTDVLTKANILANASVEQFSRAMTSGAGTAAKMAGKDIEETAAVLAAFADQGIKAEEAGTAFGIVMRDLQTKAIKNAAVFKQQGIAVYDATGNMRNMADIVGDLEKRMAGLSTEGKKNFLLSLGFADKSVAFTQALIGTSEKIRAYEAALRDAGGATAEIAANSMTPLEKANNRLRASFEQLSQSMGPLVNKLADAAEMAALIMNPDQSNSISEIGRNTKEKEGRHLLLLAEARKRHKDKQDKSFRFDEFMQNPLQEMGRFQGANIREMPKPKQGFFESAAQSIRTGSNFAANQITNMQQLGAQGKEQAMANNSANFDRLKDMFGAFMESDVGKTVGQGVKDGIAEFKSDASRLWRDMGMDTTWSGVKQFGRDVGKEFTGQGEKRKSFDMGKFSAARSGSLEAYQQKVRGSQQGSIPEKQLKVLESINKKFDDTQLVTFENIGG